MSLQDLEVLGYDPKELEKLRDEFNVSDEWIEYNSAMMRMCGTDPRINPVSQGTTSKYKPNDYERTMRLKEWRWRVYGDL